MKTCTPPVLRRRSQAGGAINPNPIWQIARVWRSLRSFATLKVGSFKQPRSGIYDMGGSVDQWVQDCWHKDYQGAPSDGSAWLDKTCVSRVIRSGSWRNDQGYVRLASRQSYDAAVRYPIMDSALRTA